MQKVRNLLGPIVNSYVLPWTKAWVAGVTVTVVQVLNDNGFNLPDTAGDTFFALGVGVIGFVLTWFFPNKTS